MLCNTILLHLTHSIIIWNVGSHNNFPGLRFYHFALFGHLRIQKKRDQYNKKREKNAELQRSVESITVEWVQDFIDPNDVWLVFILSAQTKHMKVYYEPSYSAQQIYCWEYFIAKNTIYCMVPVILHFCNLLWP